MKKILITGADGFIGSHLTELLLQKELEVRALSMYNSFNHWGWLEDIKHPANLEIVSGDIRDPNYVRKIMEGVDTVFHLAALIAIPYSYHAPASYVNTNIGGTLNICQAALDAGVKKVIHTSTSEVYGTARHVPIDENHSKQPQSPYSATKIGADAIAMSFYNAFDLPLTIARPFNTFGPRQSARAFIPSVIIQILSNKKEIHVGDLRPTRDFNYVADTCTGLLSLAECKEAEGKEVNICSNIEVSMHETLETIRKLLGSNIEIETEKERVRPDKSEVFRLLGDNSLISSLTGYAPNWSLEAGLRETIDWFSSKENLVKYKSGIYNI